MKKRPKHLMPVCVKNPCLALIAIFMMAGSGHCQRLGPPIAWWKFDDASGDKARDSEGQIDDRILNNYEWVKGVSGGALKFDGFTTVIERSPEQAPRLKGGFSIDTWV